MRWIEVCFQPLYNPQWLAGLKTPTNELTNSVTMYYCTAFSAVYKRIGALQVVIVIVVSHNGSHISSLIIGHTHSGVVPLQRSTSSHFVCSVTNKACPVVILGGCSRQRL